MKRHTYRQMDKWTGKYRAKHIRMDRYIDRQKDRKLDKYRQKEE